MPSEEHNTWIKGIGVQVDSYYEGAKEVVGADEKNTYAEPPTGYTEQPPSYPQQPPSYPEQPPSYPEQPPSYPKQPPGYGKQPPSYPKQPPSYPEQPPSYPEQPPSYPEQPPSYPEQPPSYTEQPPSYTEQPPDYSEQPPDYPEQPPGYGKQPPGYKVPPGYQAPPPGYKTPPTGGGYSPPGPGGYQQAMQPDCKPIRGKVPGPVNHLLCAKHGHVLDVSAKIIIASSLDEYKRRYPRQAPPPGKPGGSYSQPPPGKMYPPMMPDCEVVHGKVPGPANHLLCKTHGHVVDVSAKVIIANSLADYKKR